jgi:hypothetical protein
VPRIVAPRPIGQVIGAVSSARVFSISSSISKGRGLAVHLVDEGDDRDVAQAADLEQLQGARLDALGGVDHHDGGVDRGQRAVGVSEKSSWPGVSSRLKTLSPYSKVITEVTTEMPRSRSIFIQSERVSAAVPSCALHLAGELDGAAEQQQLFGQRRLAGVRVRDDREGAAAPPLFLARASSSGTGGCRGIGADHPFSSNPPSATVSPLTISSIR